MFRRFAKTMVIALCFLFVSSGTFAQTITGGISGDVTDSSGAGIPNVTVTAVSAETSQTHTAKTASNGTYTFTPLGCT